MKRDWYNRVCAAVMLSFSLYLILARELNAPSGARTL
jgi:hypothetical protein